MASRRGKSEQKFVMISVVAEKYGIHPQTLRLYEREGLIKPARSAGNTRLYDEEAIRRLEIILTLTRDLGVAVSQVEVDRALGAMGRFSFSVVQCYDMSQRAFVTAHPRATLIDDLSQIPAFAFG